MNQNFVIGFIKQAQLKGLKPLHAMDILKEAGPMDWLGKQWTNLKDTVNTGVNLSNNDFSHFLSAATSSSPEGYFDGFNKRFNRSMDIDNNQNAKANALAFQHQAEQGNLEGMKGYAAEAQRYGGYLQNKTDMDKITGNLNYTTNFWNNQQAKIQKDQEAADAIRAPAFNNVTKPLQLAEPGKALTPPNTQPLGSGLQGANPMPDLRTSFTADTNLRKPLGGY